MAARNQWSARIPRTPGSGGKREWCEERAAAGLFLHVPMIEDMVFTVPEPSAGLTGAVIKKSGGKERPLPPELLPDLIVMGLVIAAVQVTRDAEHDIIAGVLDDN